MREVERSLKRLDTDHVDVYLVHRFDELTPLEETIRALDDIVRAGKARYVGCCNYAAWASLQIALDCGQAECYAVYVRPKSIQSAKSSDGRRDV